MRNVLANQDGRAGCADSLLDRLFTVQELNPEGLESVQGEALSPFQRVLLVMDGTVTQVLEAHTGEAIDIRRLDQGRRSLEAEDRWLKAGPGEAVIDRKVLLQGQNTGRPYVYATSTIVVERLPADVQQGLTEPGSGLGRLLARSRLETYRERLWYGAQAEGADPEASRWLEANLLLSRTYRIFSQGRPLMLISEKFSGSVDATGSGP